MIVLILKVTESIVTEIIYIVRIPKLVIMTHLEIVLILKVIESIVTEIIVIAKQKALVITIKGDCTYPASDRVDCDGKNLYCEAESACNYNKLGDCTYPASDRVDCGGKNLYCEVI